MLTAEEVLEWRKMGQDERTEIERRKKEAEEEAKRVQINRYVGDMQALILQTARKGESFAEYNINYMYCEDSLEAFKKHFEKVASFEVRRHCYPTTIRATLIV